MSEAGPREERHERHERRPASERSVWARAVATLLVAVCAVLPAMVHGGVDPETFVALGAAGAVALALVAVSRRREGFPLPPAGLALAGGTVLALLSAVPWPANITSLLSARAAALATLPPEPPARLVPWSLDPAASLVDAARLAGLAALVFASAALARRERTAERLAMAVAASGLVVAGLGGVCLVANVDGFLGWATRGNSALPSPFVNPNHAASLAVLAASAAAGLALGSGPGLARLGWGVGSLGAAASAVASESVGGIGSLLLAAVVLALLARARRRAQGVLPPWTSWLPAGGVAFAAVAVLPATRWAEAMELFDLQVMGKSWPWAGTLRLIAEHPLTGVGRGAYEAAFHAFAPIRLQVTATHPENVLLHWAAEWGPVAALVGVGALCVTWGRAVRDRSGEGLLASATDGLLAGTMAVFFHDFVDFGLEFAGVAAPFAVSVGVLCAVTPRVRWPAWTAVPVVGAALLASAMAALVALPRLVERELAQAPAATPEVAPSTVDEAYRAVRGRHPADPYVTLDAANALLGMAVQPSRPREERKQAALLALPHLARAQELATNETPHLLTAKALLMLGRRAQALTEFRLAFRAAGLSLRVVDAFVANDVTAGEVASVPRSLQAASSGEWSERSYVFEPASVGAFLLNRLRELGKAPVAADAALLLLEDGGAPWVADGGFLLVGCQVLIAAAATPETSEVRAEQLMRLAGHYGASVPGVPEPFWCEAQAHLLAGRPGDAEAALRRGIDAVGGGHLLNMALGYRLLAAGKPSEVIPLVSQLPDPPTQNGIADLRNMRVVALRGAGRPQRAFAEAKGAAEEFPREGWARKLYAGQLAQEGSFAKAAEEARVAAELHSGAERERLAKWSAELATKATATKPTQAR